MPIPFIVWGISAGIATLLTGVVVSKQWGDIKKWWNGKNIAIIGARGVGKTHLCKFLLEGEIPEEYEQTAEPRKLSGRTFKLDDLKLKINDVIDTPGSKDYYRTWEKSCENADIILYLVKSYEIFDDNEDAVNRVRSDFKRIEKFIEKRDNDNKPHFFVIGTFFDKHQEYNNITDSNIGDYKDEFEKKEIIKQLKMLDKTGTAYSSVLLGSMKNKKETEKLVKILLDQVFLN